MKQCLFSLVPAILLICIIPFNQLPWTRVHNHLHRNLNSISTTTKTTTTTKRNIKGTNAIFFNQIPLIFGRRTNRREKVMKGKRRNRPLQKSNKITTTKNETEPIFTNKWQQPITLRNDLHCITTRPNKFICFDSIRNQFNYFRFYSSFITWMDWIWPIHDFHLYFYTHADST